MESPRTLIDYLFTKCKSLNSQYSEGRVAWPYVHAEREGEVAGGQGGDAGGRREGGVRLDMEQAGHDDHARAAWRTR